MRKFLIEFKEIDKVIKEIAKSGKVKAVYLFGSYAKGEQHINSDIDLCILSDDEDPCIQGAGYDNLDISIFHKLPISIRFRVLREGKPLFVRDKEFVNKMKLSTLKEYLDFKPRLDRMVAEKLRVR